MQYNYEKSVVARIEPFSDMPGYRFLEMEVQKWLDLHCADSLAGITARVYIDTLLSKSEEEVKTWAIAFINAQMEYAGKDIQYIDETTAKALFERGKNEGCLISGRFIYQSSGLFHGIDTTTGITMKASFTGKPECLDWLLMKEKSEHNANHPHKSSD